MVLRTQVILRVLVLLASVLAVSLDVSLLLATGASPSAAAITTAASPSATTAARAALFLHRCLADKLLGARHDVCLGSWTASTFADGLLHSHVLAVVAALYLFLGQTTSLRFALN